MALGQLGFGLDNWDETLIKLQDKPKIELQIEPTKTDSCCMTLTEDPDGREVELYREILKVFKIQITSFIDDHQPGWVECSFFDASGKVHIIREKVPIISSEYLDQNTEYPREGVVACEIINEWEDKNGRKIYSVRSILWGVETIEGLTEFDLLAEQLTELVR